MNWLKSYENKNLMYGFIWSQYKSKVIVEDMQKKDIFLKELHLEDEDDHDFETPTFF